MFDLSAWHKRIIRHTIITLSFANRSTPNYGGSETMSQLQQNRLPEHFYDEPFALCFSGQGFDWISSLREALADGARDKANEAAAEAARILAPVAEQLATARPQGFEPIKWAENGADGIDLVRAAVSAPGIFLSQIANLHTLEARGLDSGKAAGVIGHSQGILGRYLVREPQHAAELLALAELIGAAATLQGRATGMYLHDGLHPMVMVQGVSRRQLAAVIDELFPADSADRPCIGLQNSTDGFVVSGKPKSVARVCGVLSDTVKDANGQTPENLLWRLDVEVSFHHPAMLPAGFVVFVLTWLDTLLILLVFALTWLVTFVILVVFWLTTLLILAILVVLVLTCLDTSLITLLCSSTLLITFCTVTLVF